MSFSAQSTADGSLTFFSQTYGELFHSHTGAHQEAEVKFAAACQLAKKASEWNRLELLDICYGLGYNTAAALESIWQANPQCQVKLIALELEASVPVQAIADNLLNQWSVPIPLLLKELSSSHCLETEQFSGRLYLGDARQSIQEFSQGNFKADAIFLDPFSPPKCPQLWTVDFLTQVSQCLKPSGILATYSCAASVRNALQLTGLKVGSSVSVGRRSPGTVAGFVDQGFIPLTQKEKEHLQTRAAIPYRDPLLHDSAAEIIQRRQMEQAACQLESSSQWKKRWQKI